MLEQLKYINHVNEVFEFGKDGIFVNTNELHDYEWAVSEKGNRISDLTRQISTRKLPVVIVCDTEIKGIQARNRLLEICEKDVLAMQHGRIQIGNYYYRCFVTKSTKQNYLLSKKMMTLDLMLTSDYPYWIRETSSIFRPTAEISDPTGLDFPFDFPFDYYDTTTNTSFFNPAFVDANFKIIIYGAAVNPSISINSHVYQVNTTVDAGEYLIIDSTTKKIQRIQANGTAINEFNNRDKESYIFEKIPSGECSVTWDGEFGFDIILLEERSEPKWI